MHSNTAEPLNTPDTRVLGEQASIVLCLDDGHYRLSDGRRARSAASCLLQPQLGDQVLVAACEQGDCYILHILERADDTPACLQVAGAEELQIRQAKIRLAAHEKIALQSLQDVELSAVSGTMNINAANLFCTVRDTLLHSARRHMGRFGHYALQVKDLWQMHTKQGVVTADQDLKIDAERIHMG